MSAWRGGRVYQRDYDYGFAEVRDDVARGWVWQLFEWTGTSRTFNVVDTLAVAKRQASAEAKRLGWVPR